MSTRKISVGNAPAVATKEAPPIQQESKFERAARSIAQSNHDAVNPHALLARILQLEGNKGANADVVEVAEKQLAAELAELKKKQ